MNKMLRDFTRSQILEIYFARLDGRAPAKIGEGQEILFQIELQTIKEFLLGQYPLDPLLHRTFHLETTR